jgi:hypothetical protein
MSALMAEFVALTSLISVGTTALMPGSSPLTGNSRSNGGRLGNFATYG